MRREFSAGGVVCKKDKWLLIKPAGTDRWQFPKGHIEKSESSETAALREVEEETGIGARIVSKLGIQKYIFVWEKEKIFKFVTFFLMEFVEIKGEKSSEEVSEIIFLPFREAYERLTFKKDKELLLKAKELFESSNQNSLI